MTPKHAVVVRHAEINPQLLQEAQFKILSGRSISPGRILSPRLEPHGASLHVYVFESDAWGVRWPQPHSEFMGEVSACSAPCFAFSATLTSASEVQSSRKGLRTVEHVSASSSTYVFAS